MSERAPVTELPPGSYERFSEELDAMAHELPEVAVRRDELAASGRTLIAENGLEATFFENQGRARLFIGIAGTHADVTSLEALPATGALAVAQQHIARRERQFVEDIIAVIGHDHSQHERLVDAREEIAFNYHAVNGKPHKERKARAYEQHTDKERSRAVEELIEKHDLFADQRRLLGMSADEERPYTVRVIGLRNDREEDRYARAVFMLDIGLAAFRYLPSGWVVQGEERVMCLTEDIADAVLSHQPGDAPVLNEGLYVLLHEKGHIEHDWRLDSSAIGSALNEMGAEVLSGALPSDWRYPALRDLKDHYNESLNADRDNLDADVPSTSNGYTPPVPAAYLEDLFITTPLGGDAFAHVITGVARHAGLRTMVEMACRPSPGGEDQLQDRYHTNVFEYFGPPDKRKPPVIPLPAELRTPTAQQKPPGVHGNSVAALVAATLTYTTQLDTVRAELHASAAKLADATAIARVALAGTGNAFGEQSITGTADAYSRAQNAALLIGKAILLGNEYVRSIT